jgi:3-methyladenine DNA glycosylase/8-oxoguanine DNA glycosylase
VATRTFVVNGDLDLPRTLSPLSHGPADTTIRLRAGRVWRATRTVDGPAAIALTHLDGRIVAEAHGPGAERALADVPRLLGLSDDLDPIPPGHPLVASLARRFPGIRIPRTGAVLESLVPAILEQKVTGLEASLAWRRLLRTHGEPAPGPPEWRRRRAPTPSTLAALPYYRYHPFGVERRRADLIRRVSARAAWFEATVELPLPEAYARLTAMPGIGPWTATRSASATSISPTSSRTRSPASREGRTSGCWSCSSRTVASGRGSCACWS